MLELFQFWLSVLLVTDCNAGEEFVDSVKVWPSLQLCSVQRAVLPQSEAQLIGSRTAVEQFLVSWFPMFSVCVSGLSMTLFCSFLQPSTYIAPSEPPQVSSSVAALSLRVGVAIPRHSWPFPSVQLPSLQDASDASLVRTPDFASAITGGRTRCC